MLPNIQELLYQSLASDIADLRKVVQQILNRAERAEVAGGLANSTLANLPTVNNTGGDLYFASDGQKPGESPGLGTGTAVFWNAATNTWLRVGDYQPPSGGGSPLSLSLGGTGAALNGAGGTSFYVKLGLGATAMSVGLIADSDLPVGLAGHTITGGSIDNTPIGATTPNTAAFTNTNVSGYLRVTNIAFAASGAGVEIWYNPVSGLGSMDVYDRTGAAFKSLQIDAGSIGFNTNSNGAINTGTGLFTAGGLAEITKTLGIGIAPFTQYGITLTNVLTGSTFQRGMSLGPTFDSGATGQAIGILINTSTAAASFTVPTLYNLYISNASKGAGSTITAQYGLYIESMSSGSSNVAMQTNGGTHFFQDSVQLGNAQQTILNNVGLATKYNNIATQGWGIPSILARVNLNAQTADIVDTVFTNANVAGEYAIYWNLEVTTADGTAGTVSLNIKWSDDQAANVQGNSRSLTIKGQGNGVIFVRLSSGSITYGTTHTGTYATSQYGVYLSCQRVN